MHSLFKLFHSSRIAIALFYALLTGFYFDAMDIAVDRPYVLVTATSVFLVYRYAATILGHFHKVGFRTGLASRPWVAFSSLLWLVYMATYQSLTIFMVVLLASWLTIAYFVKISPFNKALTKNKFAKPLVTGLVFSLLTTSVPLLISEEYLWHEITKITAGNVFFITGLCVVFDIFEKYASFLTVGDLQIRSYKRSAYLLILTAGVFHAWAAYSFIISISAFVALGMTYSLTFLLIKFASPNRNTPAYHLMTDSMMALPWVLWQLLHI